MGVLFFSKEIYDQYLWKKAIVTPLHKLQAGSFIFSKRMGYNGSQSKVQEYFILKVIRIDGDYVKVSVLQQFSSKNDPAEGASQSASDQYEEMKKNIAHTIVTGILPEDFYQKGGGRYSAEDLMGKYPDLRKSSYYYMDLSSEIKNKPIPTDRIGLENYLELVYSAKHIIKEGVLRPYSLTNSLDGIPFLYTNMDEDIDLIINQSKN